MIKRNPVSMQHIADDVGVSRATVSNALRGKGRVSAEIVCRIIARAEELHYVPSAAGRALREGRSLTIGLLVPDFALPLFPRFVQAFERAARERGMALMVADSASDPERQQAAIDQLIGHGVDALAVIPMRGTRLDPARLPVPIIIIDSAANPQNIVSSDHRQGGNLIAQLLANLGHRRVVVVVSNRHSTVSDERSAGIIEVLGAHGIVHEVMSAPPNLEGGRAVAASITPERFTACAAVYDAQAVGIILELTARAVNVPQDMSVTGFDDVIWGQIVSPRLTTVSQDLDAIARHALAFASREAHESMLFPVSLIERASTAPPPPARQEANR